jgi:prepilin-type N-terminal cleavage/methylation domain-containing protein
MGYNKRGGFTLIEAIMTILIIAILSVSGGFLMVYLIQNSVFIPNQLNMEMLAKDALDIMIEGDSLARGLRFSKNITTALNNVVVFINQNNQTINYTLSANKLYRSINSSTAVNIPYYSSISGINMTGRNGTLFNYYDANDTVTNNSANVRRVRITLIAKSGSGSFRDWQGQSEQSSSIAVKKFQ